MATAKHSAPQDPAESRPIRVLPEENEDADLQAGFHIPGADPPKNENARGGFGNRDGKEGYGTDSEDGVTAVSVNSRADADIQPADNMRSTAEGRPVRGLNEDMPLDDDDDNAPDHDDTADNDRLDAYADAAEREAADEARILTQANRPRTSDTGASGESSVENLLTEDGNNVRRDQRIAGQDFTFNDLDAQGTNADLTDPDAESGGGVVG